jgi:hypothetical protein
MMGTAGLEPETGVAKIMMRRFCFAAADLHCFEPVLGRHRWSHLGMRGKHVRAHDRFRARTRTIATATFRPSRSGPSAELEPCRFHCCHKRG